MFGKVTRGDPLALSSLIGRVYNSTSCFLLFPYIIKFNPLEHKYVLQARSRIFQGVVLSQQLIVVGVFLWCLFIGPGNIMGISDVETSGDKIFAIMMTIWTISMMNIFRIIWIKKESLGHVLDQIGHLCSLLGQLGWNIPTNIQIKLASLGLVSYFILWGLSEATTILGLYNQGLSGAIVQLVQMTQQLFYLDMGVGVGHLNETEQIPMTLGDIPKTHFILSCLVTWAFVGSELASYLAAVLGLLYAIIIYILVTAFVQQLTFIGPKMNKDKFDLVIKTFDKLCKLCAQIDDLVGSLIFISIFGLLPYYAYFLETVFEGTQDMDAHGKLRCLFSNLYFGLMLILPAEANAKLTHFVTWLHDQETGGGCSTMESLGEEMKFQKKLSLICKRIQGNQIGLKGKCFTITYAFVGNVASLIVTYSIIMAQLRVAS